MRASDLPVVPRLAPAGYRIGIIMPTFNQRAHIAAALASVLDAISEAWPSIDAQLVIVDDGSTDETRQWLKIHAPSFVQIVRHAANRGTAEAINTGAAIYLARGVDALTWVSSDNEMDRNWLNVLAHHLRSMVSGQVGAVYSGYNWIGPTRRFYAFREHKPLLLLSDVNCYYGPSFLIRSDIWSGAGDHRGRISHDYDHWLRVEEECARRALRIVGIDRPLCNYSAHDKRVTVTRAAEFDAPHWQAEARKRRGL